MRSRHYDRSVAESAAHHARSKTFSGSLIVPYEAELKTMVGRLGIETALDYGCGKAVGWREGLAARVGIAKVTLYDPCVPEFASEALLEADASFDLVILCSVLFWIPAVDLPWVLDRVYSLATKAVFIAEKLGPPKKRFLSEEEAHPRGWSQSAWMDLIGRHRRPGIETTLATRTLEDGCSATSIVRL